MSTIRNAMAALLGALALAQAGTASAASLHSVAADAANQVTDYSQAGLVSFDLDWHQLSHTGLQFTVDAADVHNGSLAFNALVRNLSGLGLEQVYVSFQGAALSPAQGSVGTDGFSEVAAHSASQQVIWAQFAPALGTEFYLGNPLATTTALNWTLDLSGLQAGQQFSVLVSAVPEPGTYALVLAGLAAVGLVAARRRA